MTDRSSLPPPGPQAPSDAPASPYAPAPPDPDARNDGRTLADPVALGGLQLPNRLILAPMAGVTDRTFRWLAKRAGCGLAFSEMISDNALLWANAKTWVLAAPYPGEDPYAVQLLGKDPDTLARAAVLVVEEWGAALVDINMGCPVPKVVKNGEGAALLRDPSLCGRIIERVHKAVAGRARVSCKIRLGFDSPTSLDVARAVASAGASFVSVHGRLRTETYSTPADWEGIAGVAETLSRGPERVPVVGNGDVLEPGDAVSMLARTGVHAVMVGRGALGNPWIFSRALSLARTGDPGPPPSAAERVRAAIEHLDALVRDKGERGAVLEMRRHGSWYIRGLPRAAGVRSRLMRVSKASEMASILEDYLDHLEHPGGHVDSTRKDGPSCPTSDV